MHLECGGGTILIFLLTTFSMVDQHFAQGANLIFFIPTCIVSIIINLKNKNINLKNSFVIMISGTLGAIIGSVISANLKVNYLKKYFGIFLLLIAGFEIFTMLRKNNLNQ